MAIDGDVGAAKIFCFRLRLAFALYSVFFAVKNIKLV